MAIKSKHLKENVKQKNSKKRADKKAAPQSQKFNFDNEIVIGVNVIPKNQKDKPSASKRNNAVKKVSNKKACSDYQKTKNNKNIESKGIKDKKQKKVNFKRIIKIILLMAFIIGATIFVMTTPIFNVTEINVEGNSRISNERIESLSKISLNVNTYQYSKKNIIENIKEEPYIESVQVKRKLPSTIIINVEERNRDFFISNYGSYIYIDKQGYILEISNEVEKLPEIKGFSTSTENLVPGNRISDDDLEKIEDIIMEINNSLNNGHSNAKYLLSILKNLIIDNDIFDGISDHIMWILIDYLLNVIFKYQILTENVSLLIIAILDKYEQIDKVKFIDNAITKRNSKKDTTKEIVDIWITYIITLFNLESNAINNYFKLIINESDICAIMILNYYHQNNSIEENKASIKDYLDSIKTSLKSKYDTNWLNASWLSKHWLLFYLNETKWNIDAINGFKDTILADAKLDKLLEDDTLSTRLNIFNIMKNLDIDVLNYENTR